MSVIGLSADKIKHLLKIDSKVMLFESLESTNLFAKELAASGKACEGDIIIALSQTYGRGRLGRSFYSPACCGVYFSIVLKPNIPINDISLITPVAAVAVATAIEKATNKSPKIKWVNDIFLNGKKVCGILSEAAFTADGIGSYVILGVGINLVSPKGGYPEDIKNIAGSIFEGEEVFDANCLVADIINNFFDCYKDLNNKDLLIEYRKRMMLIGDNINYTVNATRKTGKVVGLDERFRIIVESDAGEREALQSGEVSIGSGNI
ncbi:MAG: biotin--[Clostridia bacterium]|nr:biotin--[acetyl-CoA-carboxylase] ligase [Clostridia bacterium]